MASSLSPLRPGYRPFSDTYRHSPVTLSAPVRHEGTMGAEFRDLEASAEVEARLAVDQIDALRSPTSVMESLRRADKEVGEGGVAAECEKDIVAAGVTTEAAAIHDALESFGMRLQSGSSAEQEGTSSSFPAAERVAPLRQAPSSRIGSAAQPNAPAFEVAGFGADEVNKLLHMSVANAQHNPGVAACFAKAQRVAAERRSAVASLGQKSTDNKENDGEDGKKTDTEATAPSSTARGVDSREAAPPAIPESLVKELSEQRTIITAMAAQSRAASQQQREELEKMVASIAEKRESEVQAAIQASTKQLERATRSLASTATGHSHKRERMEAEAKTTAEARVADALDAEALSFERDHLARERQLLNEEKTALMRAVDNERRVMARDIAAERHEVRRHAEHQQGLLIELHRSHERAAKETDAERERRARLDEHRLREEQSRLSHEHRQRLHEAKRTEEEQRARFREMERETRRRQAESMATLERLVNAQAAERLAADRLAQPAPAVAARAAASAAQRDVGVEDAGAPPADAQKPAKGSAPLADRVRVAAEQRRNGDSKPSLAALHPYRQKVVRPTGGQKAAGRRAPSSSAAGPAPVTKVRPFKLSESNFGVARHQRRQKFLPADGDGGQNKKEVAVEESDDNAEANGEAAGQSPQQTAKEPPVDREAACTPPPLETSTYQEEDDGTGAWVTLGGRQKPTRTTQASQRSSPPRASPTKSETRHSPLSPAVSPAKSQRRSAPASPVKKPTKRKTKADGDADDGTTAPSSPQGKEEATNSTGAAAVDSHAEEEARKKDAEQAFGPAATRHAPLASVPSGALPSVEAPILLITPEPSDTQANGVATAMDKQEEDAAARASAPVAPVETARLFSSGDAAAEAVSAAFADDPAYGMSPYDEAASCWPNTFHTVVNGLVHDAIATKLEYELYGKNAAATDRQGGDSTVEAPQEEGQESKLPSPDASTTAAMEEMLAEYLATGIMLEGTSSKREGAAGGKGVQGREAYEPGSIGAVNGAIRDAVCMLLSDYVTDALKVAPPARGGNMPTSAQAAAVQPAAAQESPGKQKRFDDAPHETAVAHPPDEREVLIPSVDGTITTASTDVAVGPLSAGVDEQARPQQPIVLRVVFEGNAPTAAPAAAPAAQSATVDAAEQSPSPARRAMSVDKGVSTPRDGLSEPRRDSAVGTPQMVVTPRGTQTDEKPADKSPAAATAPSEKVEQPADAQPAAAAAPQKVPSKRDATAVKPWLKRSKAKSGAPAASAAAKGDAAPPAQEATDASASEAAEGDSATSLPPKPAAKPSKSTAGVVDPAQIMAAVKEALMKERDECTAVAVSEGRARDVIVAAEWAGWDALAVAMGALRSAHRESQRVSLPRAQPQERQQPSALPDDVEVLPDTNRPQPNVPGIAVNPNVSSLPGGPPPLRPKDHGEVMKGGDAGDGTSAGKTKLESLIRDWFELVDVDGAAPPPHQITAAVVEATEQQNRQQQQQQQQQNTATPPAAQHGGGQPQPAIPTWPAANPQQQQPQPQPRVPNNVTAPLSWAEHARRVDQILYGPHDGASLRGSQESSSISTYQLSTTNSSSLTADGGHHIFYQEYRRRQRAGVRKALVKGHQRMLDKELAEAEAEEAGQKPARPDVVSDVASTSSGESLELRPMQYGAFYSSSSDGSGVSSTSSDEPALHPLAVLHTHTTSTRPEPEQMLANAVEHAAAEFMRRWGPSASLARQQQADVERFQALYQQHQQFLAQQPALLAAAGTGAGPVSHQPGLMAAQPIAGAPAAAPLPVPGVAPGAAPISHAVSPVAHGYSAVTPAAPVPAPVVPQAAPVPTAATVQAPVPAPAAMPIQPTPAAVSAPVPTPGMPQQHLPGVPAPVPAAVPSPIVPAAVAAPTVPAPIPTAVTPAVNPVPTPTPVPVPQPAVLPQQQPVVPAYTPPVPAAAPAPYAPAATPIAPTPQNPVVPSVVPSALPVQQPVPTPQPVAAAPNALPAAPAHALPTAGAPVPGQQAAPVAATPPVPGPVATAAAPTPASVVPTPAVAPVAATAAPQAPVAPAQQQPSPAPAAPAGVDAPKSTPAPAAAPAKAPGTAGVKRKAKVPSRFANMKANPNFMAAANNEKKGGMVFTL